MNSTGTSRLRFARALLVLNGLTYSAVGVALLLAPEWFFTNVGNFPPFNRHYAGDLGSFQLALGVALLYAARRPAEHTGLLFVAAAGGLLHAFNHAADALHGTGGWDQTLELLFLAALTVAALWQLTANGQRAVPAT